LIRLLKAEGSVIDMLGRQRWADLRLAGRLREPVQALVEAGRDVRGEQLRRISVWGASGTALLRHG
jgi:hypothetical protein